MIKTNNDGKAIPLGVTIVAKESQQALPLLGKEDPRCCSALAIMSAAEKVR